MYCTLSYAQELLAMGRADPVAALEAAEQQLEGAQMQDGVQQVVLLAAGLAARTLAKLDRAERYLLESIACAEQQGDDAGVGEASLTLSGALFLQGRVEEALEVLGSISATDGVMGARVLFQAGTINARSGKPDAALFDFSEALQRIGEGSGTRLEASIRKNRALLNVERGFAAEAIEETTIARAIFADLGLDLEVAFCGHNLGLASLLHGDLVGSFEYFRTAYEQMEVLKLPEWEAHVGYCRALASAGLFEDCLVESLDIAQRMADAGLELERAEALLLAATADAHGEGHYVERLAGEAHRLFSSQKRMGWAAQAALVGATFSDADPSAVEELAAELIAGGFIGPAVRACLHVANLVVESDPARAEQILDEVAEYIETGPIDLQMSGRLVATKLLLSKGDADGALVGAAAGIRSFIDHQNQLGSSELSVSLSAHAAELASTGVEMALEGGDAQRILDWLELQRATLVAPFPVTASGDEALGRLTAQLRAIEAGGWVAGDSVDAERRTLQRAIRSQSWTTRQTGLSEGSEWKLGERLGTRALISYGIVGSEIFAVCVRSGETTLHRNLASPDVYVTIRALQASIRRQAVSPGERKDARLDLLLEMLDEALVEPLGVSGEHLLVSPTVNLFAVPWGALPSRQGAPTQVLTSTGGVDLVERELKITFIGAGPGLEYAGEEVSVITRAIPNAVATRNDLSCKAALEAFNTSDVVHLACHGTSHSDNPLMSSLRLFDGELFAYEVEQLVSIPAVVVLSACSVGSASQTSGKDLLGFVSVLLRKGARTVIASPLPVADSDHIGLLFARFHGLLNQGLPAAEAFANAVSAVEDPVFRQHLSTTFTNYGPG